MLCYFLAYLDLFFSSCYSFVSYRCALFWRVSVIYFIFLYSAFRTNMHGSVCLFSRYLNNLLEGENLDELDISSASSSNNIFSNQNSLSTGWKGTCQLVNQYNDIYSDYSTELNSLNALMTTNLNELLNYFSVTNSLLTNLFTANFITSSRPSGSTASLLPKSEYEFSDMTNTSLIGGKIYKDFVDNLLANLLNLNDTIKIYINHFLSSDAHKGNINDAYTNFANFDVAVATAANIMNENMLDLKDYFNVLQFIVMFFTWAYMFFFGVTILLYIIYACKKINLLWYFIVILIHILLLMMLVEIFMASFFGQVRLICNEIPRAINFIFTGTYMTSGNSASYPAKFGTGNANMTKMFTECLNGDGDLANLFLSSSVTSTISDIKSRITYLYINMKSMVDKSNIATNSYNYLLNSDLTKGIIKLETMKDNLYMATEGFGSDDIYYILNVIRTNLDSTNCSMAEEYYVIKDADCPSGSVRLTTIYNTTGTLHCYVIPSLSSSASASYVNSGCNNDYINTAITFIKEIYSSIDSRLNKLINLQQSYSITYSYLMNEIESISNRINSTYDMLYSNSDSSTISNCGSSRFDLIDFCDFIGVTTEYDARLVLIFGSFVGTFGYVFLYSFLVVLNSLENTERDTDYDDFGYDYGKKNNKIRNININVNKTKPIKRDSYDQDDEEYDINKKNVKPNVAQKVEMSYLSKNNEDSDSS